MNVKQAIVVTLLIVTSSQVMAKRDAMQNQERPPQRPTFESIDTNEDGDIDFDEFSSHELPHGDHQTVFDEMDTNNNGVISTEEYTNHKPPRPKKFEEKS